jgi:hypothetical protein
MVGDVEPGSQPGSSALFRGVLLQALLVGVTCLTAMRCVVVGESIYGSPNHEQTRDLVERWRGDTASVVGTSHSVNLDDELDAVACPNTRFCMAVGRHYAYKTGGARSPAALTGAR